MIINSIQFKTKQKAKKYKIKNHKKNKLKK